MSWKVHYHKNLRKKTDFLIELSTQKMSSMILLHIFMDLDDESDDDEGYTNMFTRER